MAKRKKKPAPSKIDQLRDQTYHECLDLLRQHKKCCMVRPTGFGKTGLLTRLISDQHYKHILYLYPAEVIRSAVFNFYYGTPDEDSIPNTTFMTYMKFIRMSDEAWDDLGDFDLIIADECHRLGAPETSKMLDYYLESHPNVHLFGATATPDRMDLVDIMSRYFNDHYPFEYTLHDAFQDGIMKPPYYVYCKYAESEANQLQLPKKTLQEIAKLDSKRDQLQIKADLDDRMIRLAEIYNMNNVIRRVCSQHATSTDYMKFIVFYTSHADMAEKGVKVKDWFQNAFPNHEINITHVSSETKEYTKNAKRLHELTHTSQRIDLIYACAMLDLGIHIDDITGILMYRTTKSHIVYSQEFGRVISSGATNSAIVFDVVDNIHIQAVYSVLGKESVYTAAARKRKAYLLSKKALYDRYQQFSKGLITASDLTKNELSIFTAIQNGTEPAPTFTKLDESELNALIRRFNQPSTKLLVSQLKKEDLFAIDLVASYREEIAKTVAEARSMRCRQAWAHWNEIRAQEELPTDPDGKIFTRAYINSIPPKGGGDIPLPPFCYLKQVSVEAVLDEMGIPA